jgi:phosphate transport system permease protein
VSTANNPFKATKVQWVEWIFENSIRIVASFSILVIFLIFIFVFREATTLFFPQEVKGATTITNLPPPSDPRIKVPLNPKYPEIYNPETGNLPKDIDEVPTHGSESVKQQTSVWQRLVINSWQPVGEVPKYGLWPLFIGTAKTTLIAILIGAPLGVLAAMYSAFFASKKLRGIIKPAIELLAGFPSVVIGFFCLATVATFVQDTLGVEFRLNALVGGIGLSLAVIPIVYSIAEDSLAAVPGSLRAAALAVGSTEWQTAYKVMLPAAAPGVIAAIILGVGRAFGETMIAIMATGNAPLMSWGPFTPARTFAATIGSEMGEVVWGSEHYGVLFLLGSGLFVVSFGLNALTELYVKTRLIKKFQGL